MHQKFNRYFNTTKGSKLLIFPLLFFFILKFLNFIFKTNFIKSKIDFLEPYIYFKKFNLKLIDDVYDIETLFFEKPVLNQNHLPKIYNISEGGIIYNSLKGRQLKRLKYGIFYLGSDFIRINESEAINEKFFKKEYLNLNAEDTDLLMIKNGQYYLSNTTKTIYSKKCFHLNGTFAFTWAHFVFEQLPKLELLNFISKETIDIFLPENIDKHIKKIINDYVNNFPRVKLFFINRTYKISAEILYVPINNTFIANNSNYFTPLQIQIADSTVNFVSNIFQTYSVKYHNSDLKIFLGYKGTRNLINYDEIEDMFTKNGYQVVYPHELEFENKVKLFSSAQRIAGVGSSAFVNTIFSKKDTKILAFVPNNRSLDTGLEKFHRHLSHESYFFSGKDSDTSSLSTSFTINKDELNTFCYLKNFF
jgi:hypothetical protein